jgi:hypothetical protein
MMMHITASPDAAVNLMGVNAFYICFCALAHTILGATNMPIIFLVNIRTHFVSKKNPLRVFDVDVYFATVQLLASTGQTCR